MQMSRRQVHIDDSKWPLVRMHFPTDEWPDDEFERYLKYLEDNLNRAERAGVKTALLFNASGSPNADAQRRKWQADWMKKHNEQSARMTAGYAFVIDSTVVRGLLTAILWLAPMPAPHTVVRTEEEAESWLRARLAEANDGSLSVDAR